MNGLKTYRSVTKYHREGPTETCTRYVDVLDVEDEDYGRHQGHAVRKKIADREDDEEREYPEYAERKGYHDGLFL